MRRFLVVLQIFMLIIEKKSVIYLNVTHVWQNCDICLNIIKALSEKMSYSHILNWSIRQAFTVLLKSSMPV